MKENKFEYEVAFSFLENDEILALRINDLIQDKIKTFIYTHHQKEIAGTDGEMKLNEVFSEKARKVVVFYRDGWGETSWTRIEETAIRNRAYEYGYDFVTFILLDKQSKLPKWLPKNRIWLDYERWREKGAASVIESRVYEQGGTTRPETIEEQAERIKRELKAQQERKKYLNSIEGYNDAHTEFNSLFQQVEKRGKSLVDPKTGLYFGFEKKPNNKIVICCERYNLHFSWNCAYSNSLDGSKLIVALTKDDRSGDPLERRNDQNINKTDYRYDITLTKTKGWSEMTRNECFYTSGQLIDNWVRKFFEKVKKAKLKIIKERI